jgi:hypothetical protein
MDHSTWADGDHIWPYMLLVQDKCALVPIILNGHADSMITDFCDNSGRKTCSDPKCVVFISEIPSVLCSHVYSSLTTLNYSYG